QATAYIPSIGPPRNIEDALLLLAQWCQARRTELTGASPCPTPADPASPPASPPAPEASHAARAVDPTLVGPAPGPASGSAEGAQPDRRPEPPARRAEGGRP